MAADTSSSAAASKSVVGPAAFAVAALIVEPMFLTSAAADANVSGLLIKYDISRPPQAAIPCNRPPPLQPITVWIAASRVGRKSELFPGISDPGTRQLRQQIHVRRDFYRN